MSLTRKLDLLNLNDKERAKAEEKFLATLALVSEEELKENLEYLSSQGVQIKNAREIKALAASNSEIIKNFDILNEINEAGIYREDPTLISRNAIDIYKKIKYCKQNGISYKREDGTYELFLSNEAAWQNVFNKKENAKSIIDSELSKLNTGEPISSLQEDHIDINMAKDTSELDAKTTNFARIRSELESQLAELDDLKSKYSEMAFDEQPMRRVA